MTSQYEGIGHTEDGPINPTEQEQGMAEVPTLNIPEKPSNEKELLGEADKAQVESVVKKSRNKGLLIMAFPVIASLAVVGHDLYREGSNNPKLAKIANEIRLMLDVAKEGGTEEHSLAHDVSEELGPLALQKILHSKGPTSESEREKIRAEIAAPSVELGGDISAYLQEVDVREAVVTCIPNGFAVQKISFAGNLDTDSEALTLRGGNTPIACVRDGTHNIELFSSARTCSPALTLKALFHEASHCADAENSVLMTTAEKVKLQHMLLGRIHAPNRYKSDYVESIGAGDAPAEAEEVMRAKTTEYFAEIMSCYLSEPALLSQEDLSIVEFAMKKHAPNFDIKSANATFRKLLRIVNSRVTNARRDGAPNRVYNFDSNNAAIVFNQNGAVRFVSGQNTIAHID